MEIKLLIDNKNGNMLDISDLVSEISWKTQRKGKPSSLDFKIVKDKNFSIHNGDIVRFIVDKIGVFYGYVFEYSGEKSEEIKVTAYDQLRYLLFNDTYVFKNKKASEIIKNIANDLGLKLGTIEDTSYVIPSLLEDDKKLLDIIYDSLEKTMMSTKNTYTFYDDFGSLTLKNINNLRMDKVISDDSNLGDYDWSNSIDNEVYNRIKLVRDNKETKWREVYIAKDSKNIAKWGRLQYYKKVDENMNKAQIEEMLNATLKLKNRENKTLRLKDVVSTGSEDLKLRAGSGVYVEIKNKNISQYYLIEEATHKFSKNGLVMDFELKVV